MLSFVHRAGVPAELVQIVNGVAETAGALIDEVDIISFTGSVATGKKVMERASKTLTPVLLELGGKDPMIVCRDADLERAAKGAVFGSHFNTGQVCISVETCYVEAPVYDRFVALVLEESRHLRVGQESLTGEAIDMGPMMSLRQLEIVEKQVQDAVERGAKVLLGGKRIVDKDGYFFEPTVLTDVTPDMDIMQQETFGPVLPVVRVEDADEAMRLSNTSDFGLGSSVWTRDKNKGMELARQMEAGSTCVNDVIVNYLMPELPMGAIKQSGFGQRHGGADGIRMFCRVHSILVDRIGLKRELYWFPYSRRIEKLLAKGIDLLFKR
jgi:acyl-CoA reductase-like NAD-dependent aldehyde dehydrogenase